MRGTWAFGSSALDIQFPGALTTQWRQGSRQEVAWMSSCSHRGGYTYRLCRLPAAGRPGLTEECFAQTVLSWATDSTLLKPVFTDWSKEHKAEYRKKEDVTIGTHPRGSAWRPCIPTEVNTVRMDWVVVPASLPPGEYVLSFRWDAKRQPQVWVSCANIRIVE